MNSKASNSLLHMLSIVRDSGYGLDPETAILDFGCGAGRTVQELGNLGFQAFGCDFNFKQEDKVDTNSLVDRKLIKKILPEPYRLPFEDNTFDVVLSNQVFEHVQNYPETLAEINRVLKSGGLCLHIFPSRYKPIEPHVHVPLSSVIRLYPWLYLWAILGIRNQHQIGLSPREAVHRNRQYLESSTNYLKKTDIRKHFKKYYEETAFREDLFLKHSKRGKYIHRLSKIIPFIPSLYSTFRARVVLARFPVNVTE